MQLNDYQQRALTTAIYRREFCGNLNLSPDIFFSDKQQLNLLGKNYTVVGFLGEVGEFLKEPNDGELGGVFWYTAACASEYGMTLTDFLSQAANATFDDLLDNTAMSDITDIAVAALELANQWKKVMRDGKQVDVGSLMTAVIKGLILLTDNSVWFGHCNPNKAAAHNLEQLASRAKRGKLQGDGDNR